MKINQIISKYKPIQKTLNDFITDLAVLRKLMGAKGKFHLSRESFLSHCTKTSSPLNQIFYSFLSLNSNLKSSFYTSDGFQGYVRVKVESVMSRKNCNCSNEENRRSWAQINTKLGIYSSGKMCCFR